MEAMHVLGQHKAELSDKQLRMFQKVWAYYSRSSLSLTGIRQSTLAACYTLQIWAVPGYPSAS
jgi:hypothetical protein